MGCYKKTSVSIGSLLNFLFFFLFQATTITFAVSPTPPWERLLSRVVTTSEQDFGTVKECRAFPFQSLIFQLHTTAVMRTRKLKENSFTLELRIFFFLKMTSQAPFESSSRHVLQSQFWISPSDDLPPPLPHPGGISHSCLVEIGKLLIKFAIYFVPFLWI